MREDFLAVVNEKRFLGREFLTWLVHRIDDVDARVEHAGDMVELQLGDCVVLEGEPPTRARVTLAVEGDVRPELGAALRRGRLVDRARLVIVRKDRRWELTLDGGMLCYDGLRCPPLGERDGGADGDQRAQLENDLFLRLADLEEAIGVLDGLFAEFCTLRGGSAWQARELPALRAWVADL